VIRLRVPGELQYRDLAIRVVAAACKLVRDDEKSGDRDFESQVVSAFGEAFNNVAIHGYEGRERGDVDVEIEVEGDRITIYVTDTGSSFDFTNVPEPALDDLPEGGLGVFIIKSFMDEVSYRAGRPNVLRITKRFGAHAAPERPDRSDEAGDKTG